MVAARGNGLIMAPNPHLPAQAGIEAAQRYREAWTGDNGTPPRIARVQGVFPLARSGALREDIQTYLKRQHSIGVYQGPWTVTSTKPCNDSAYCMTQRRSSQKA